MIFDSCGNTKRAPIKSHLSKRVLDLEEKALFHIRAIQELAGLSREEILNHVRNGTAKASHTSENKGQQEIKQDLPGI